MTIPMPGVTRNPRNHADDIAELFGNGGTVALVYGTNDANANLLKIITPEGGATDVPGIVLGDASIDGVDLGWFDGLTEPFFAVVNDAADAYIRIDAGDDAVAGSKGIYFKAAADEDIELLNLSVGGTPRIFWDESDDRFSTSHGWRFQASIIFESNIASDITVSNGLLFKTVNTDNTSVSFGARDNGVTQVQVAILQGGADPYFGVIRDDTGVATNAIVDGLVLGMGAGANNEAAGHGFGISVKLGNAASEIEERGQIDLRLVTATNGAEDSGWDFYTQAAGAANLAFKVDQVGELYADADGSSAAYLTNGVNLFDSFDDVEELRKFQLTVPRTGLISEEQRLANRERMTELGIWERNAKAQSGYMMKMQPMFRLMAGGIFQTRQMLERLEKRIECLEAA